MAITQWKRLRSLREPSAKCTIWSLPLEDEHVLNTGSPEDLLLDPEDFDIIPELVQDGENRWTREPLTTTNWYSFGFADQISEFYVVDIGELDL